MPQPACSSDEIAPGWGLAPPSATAEVLAIDESGRSIVTAIAQEWPLTLYLDKREIVTLMTLGTAAQDLAIGYLRNQRFLASPEDIASVQVDWSVSAVAVTSRSLAEEGIPVWERAQGGISLGDRMQRRTVTTGCGQGTMFGDLLDAISPMPVGEARLSVAVLGRIIERMRSQASIYRVAGAVHGCALCSNAPGTAGEVLQFVEDVGRHNAVDAIAGWMWRHGVQGGDKIFYTTGRLSSEMVLKCAQIGVPFLLSRSGLTHMGYQLAQRLGITMIGRCQGRHYLLFTGAQRFEDRPPPVADSPPA